MSHHPALITISLLLLAPAQDHIVVVRWGASGARVVYDRGEAFHRYSEKATAADPDTVPEHHYPASAPASLLTDGNNASHAQQQHCRDRNSACPDWANNGQCQANESFMKEQCRQSCKLCEPEAVDPAAHRSQLLILRTPKGDIRIRPQWATAPKAAALVMDLASQEDDGVKAACRFYRNEAAAEDKSEGPPYGLLQGSLAGLVQVPAQEGAEAPTRGACAQITGTTEFYISLVDHTSWGTAHTVWGLVEDDTSMQVAEAIVRDTPYETITHPQYGTVMRMMKGDVKFTPVVAQLPALADVQEL